MISDKSICFRIQYRVFDYFQFLTNDLFHFVDHAGRNHTLSPTEHHICDEKSPILVEVTEKIEDKNLLPLTGYFYGPLEVEGQSFAIRLGQLTCEENMVVENDLTIESQSYNLHQKQNTIVQSVNENLTKLEVQVNLFQKPSFLHQLTHNMTRDFSLNFPKNTSSQPVVYKNCFSVFVLTFKTIFVHNML